ncbi:MAG: hypothetical protein ROO76_10325 [Terriglobia bacterium]|nr:hypothetical protein [Terriglobia bacterium]
MKITVWTVTSDTDSGLSTSVHATQKDAYIETKGRLCNSTEEEAVFDKHIGAGNFDELASYLQSEIEGSLDSFNVEEHTLEVSDAVSPWKALERLLGPSYCSEFMYMGRDQDRGLEMYKHINSRRYLNIDPTNGDTYRRGSGNDWARVQPGEAIRFARSIE